ncbi:MAG: hypothetical protein Q8S03_13540 [Brevundimonas sp.]|uniref:hypothetical protein n=1 Tax=Brevundimonas sp. TaxID=1871086 RepID=UPI0027358A86|nr:hypothetical protein [Brevundimonas sp.]MDP3405714.1 hypothetical protein [Brevundimonas sp.]
MIRGLTPGECTLIRTAFTPDLPLDAVRLLAAPWPLVRAFVPGRGFARDWIVWPRRDLPADFSTAPMSLQAVLIHEMVHVWQARSGVNLLLAKLRAGDGPAAYRYPAVRCDWTGLNIEQQAMVVEHRFRASRGQAVPGDAAHYAAICPVQR